MLRGKYGANEAVTALMRVTSSQVRKLLMEARERLEAAAGVEPASRGFADLRLNHLATPPRQGWDGAGNGIRTRDFDLGKVALYH